MNRSHRRRFPFLGVAWTVFVAISAPGFAQPPTNYDRWDGSTAMSQIQGFGQGNPIRLTWGFMDDGTPINDGNNAPSNLQARLNSIYAGGQTEWQPLFQSVFDRWSSISGLSYTFEPNDDGATFTGATNPAGLLGTRADVRIGGKNIDGNSGVLAYNYFPNVGDMVIDTNDNFFNTTTNNSLRLRNVVAHEHGHGIGQPHVESVGSNFLMEPFASTAFDGPQYHDILAAQRHYGDANEKSFAGLGNDVSTRATHLGTLTSTLSIGQSAKTFVVLPTATDFVSIDDTGDTDFFSFDITAPTVFSAHLEAMGFVYNVTPQDVGGATPFNSRARSDLTLALFDTNGTSMLTIANDTGLGGNESLFRTLFATGRYFLRVTGLNNADSSTFDVQFFVLNLRFTPVPEASSLMLVGAVGLFFARRLRRR